HQVRAVESELGEAREPDGTGGEGGLFEALGEGGQENLERACCWRLARVPSPSREPAIASRHCNSHASNSGRKPAEPRGYWWTHGAGFAESQQESAVFSLG